MVVAATAGGFVVAGLAAAWRLCCSSGAGSGGARIKISVKTLRRGPLKLPSPVWAAFSGIKHRAADGTPPITSNAIIRPLLVASAPPGACPWSYSADIAVFSTSAGPRIRLPPKIFCTQSPPCSRARTGPRQSLGDRLLNSCRRAQSMPSSEPMHVIDAGDLHHVIDAIDQVAERGRGSFFANTASAS